jgi:hypothetical protein
MPVSRALRLVERCTLMYFRKLITLLALLIPTFAFAQFTTNCVLIGTGANTIGCSTVTTATLPSLTANQTFSGAILFTGSANFTTGSFGVNAVGFYVSGNTLFSIASDATFVMAPTIGTATSSTNYGSTVFAYENAYWQGSASTIGAFLGTSTPAIGSNPLITLNHTFNANYVVGSGGTGTGQEYWAYPTGFSLLYGPATAPSGSCTIVGWEFTNDGHASYCNGTTWATKI